MFYAFHREKVTGVQLISHILMVIIGAMPLVRGIYVYKARPRLKSDYNSHNVVHFYK